MFKTNKIAEQLFQGSIVYELVGIYPAQDFFAVNQATGAINITRDLATDSFETMQYTVSCTTFLLLFTKL